MAQKQAPIFVSTSVFEDIDHFTEVGRDWDADFRQLDRGPLNARLLQAATGTVRLTEARFDRRIEQRGSSPNGFVTVAVPIGTDPKIIWRQRQIGSGAVLIYGSGSEIDGASRPGFHVVAVSYEGDTLVRLAADLGLQEVAGLVHGADEVHLPASTMQRLQAALLHACSALRQRPPGSVPNIRRRLLENHLPTVIVRALAVSTPAPRPVPVRGRRGTLRKALDFLQSHPYEAVTVSDLCSATGSSERVLQYAFREHFDVTPGAYLKASRLVAVRRQLRQSNPRKGTIADFANDLGFWHLGQFAADYRRHFGELPSETQRSRGC